eukprot:Skav234382  [mRNA]  locus=scaffold2071:270705:274448:- [translate_table: standard]
MDGEPSVMSEFWIRKGFRASVASSTSVVRLQIASHGSGPCHYLPAANTCCSRPPFWAKWLVEEDTAVVVFTSWCSRCCSRRMASR